MFWHCKLIATIWTLFWVRITYVIYSFWGLTKKFRSPLNRIKWTLQFRHWKYKKQRRNCDSNMTHNIKSCPPDLIISFLLKNACMHYSSHTNTFLSGYSCISTMPGEELATSAFCGKSLTVSLIRRVKTWQWGKYQKWFRNMRLANLPENYATGTQKCRVFHLLFEEILFSFLLENYQSK